MAELVIDGDRLCIRMSRWERLGSIKRNDVCAPLSAIVAVEASPNPFRSVRGLRIPGTYVPRLVALGTYRRRPERDFAVAYNDRPGYVIELRGHEYDRLIVSSSNVPELDARAG